VLQISIGLLFALQESTQQQWPILIKTGLVIKLKQQPRATFTVTWHEAVARYMSI
ncbi:hypothetical protein ACJX0J_032419, partial [Zea mays]